ncbi:hypothetical protein F511_34092 [Dorcoceras hygrometricum]|uniref:Uncharacterized protein n=1 Tax=Dorcoceras hygrometricum TaxID=472368 RepID=A0A2Z7D6Z5_9LAMI|nr:hypothetical protein F511_34092 [Dorcoceras hygrometricum]
MTSALLIESNRDSETMISACLLEEATNSDDDISSDVITITNTTAFCLRAKESAEGFCDGNDQQEATVHPDASNSTSRRKQQYIQTTGFLLMNCHGIREFRTDAKFLFSLCCKITWSEVGDMHMGRNRRMKI